MPRRTVDLTAHLNQTVERGHPADFPVGLKPLFARTDGSFTQMPGRRAVVREDTGQPIAVVSDRYTLVPHQQILDLVASATAGLDVGPVPRGVYVDRNGARMRAVFKFPALARPVTPGDEICPCLKVQNTYDGSSRIAIHIGAFRFVCTNLAVGGGGAFAGGFMAIHQGEIPIEEMSERLGSYLARFDVIVELYQAWLQRAWEAAEAEAVAERLPKELMKRLTNGQGWQLRTVFDAYNVATRYATHETRSYRIAFDLLDRINRSFQEQFPFSAS
jgi:hypothetical protein